jgi:hypothetical protein
MRIFPQDAEGRHSNRDRRAAIRSPGFMQGHRMKPQGMEEKRSSARISP